MCAIITFNPFSISKMKMADVKLLDEASAFWKEIAKLAVIGVITGVGYWFFPLRLASPIVVVSSTAQTKPASNNTRDTQFVMDPIFCRTEQDVIRFRFQFSTM